jgi:hypothetical protein
VRYYSNDILAHTFEQANYSELSPIFNQLGIIQSETYPSRFLAKKVTEEGGNAIANIFRDGEATGYLDMLNQISSGLGLENIQRSQPETLRFDDSQMGQITPNSRSRVDGAILRLENSILDHISQKIHESLDSEQKAAFSREISEKLKDFDNATKAKLLGAGGLLSVGSMGGFATYTTMSSLLHFISAGTLGFGAYTAASTVLSIALGPAGWATLGVFALVRSSSPKLKKLLPIVLTVALIRKRIT